MYTCPKCQKNVKDLKSHLKRKHANETTDINLSHTIEHKNKATPTKIKLEMEVPKQPKKGSQVRYKCGWGCGYFSDKKFAICPQCNQLNEWGD